jgi:CBS domain-containing protein
MTTVKQMLDSKGYDVWTIGPDETVFEAISLMVDKGIGALVVVKEKRVVGIVSERDYMRNVILRGRSSRNTPVKDIMSSNVIGTNLGRSAEECMAIISEKRIRHLPVMDGDRLIGIISIGDLVKSIIDHQQFMIEQLENYIAS